MTSSLFNIGTSALLANQRGQATVGNNIANVNTDGFSRQTVDFAETTPVRSGGNFLGTGVEVAAINRAFDQFANDSLVAAIASNSQQSQLQSLAGQADNLLASQDTGLAPALDRFFSALSDVATDPTDTAARRTALTEAESLAVTFRDMSARLEELRNNTNNQIRTTVTDINSRAETLARLNADIQAAGSQVSNNLLDQRDQEIRALAEQIGVSTVSRNTGAIDVFVASGQPLVLGTNSQALTVTTPDGDPAQPAVTLATAGGATVDLTDRLTGGSLTGLVEFRERFVSPAQNSLGRIASTLTAEFNTQNRLGLDLNGQFGGDFFQPLATDAARVFFDPDNTGSASVSAQIADASALNASDYELVRSGSNFTVTRLSDGAAFDVSADLGGGAPASTTVDGVQIDLAAGSVDDGDRFLIQPSRQAAAAFAVNIADPARLAAAGPLQGRSDLANSGNASISPVEVTNTTNLPLATNGGPITLTFDAANNEFTVAGGPGGTLAYNPATDGDGKTFNLSGFGGMEFTISGIPDGGDQLRIEDNLGAVGDNRNALALNALQGAATVGGNASFNEAYGSIVSDVGTRSRQVQLAAEAQGARLDAARSQREAIAGVNLEEEAAKLLQLQQAFQAAARTVAVADETFQSLLRAVGG